MHFDRDQKVRFANKPFMEWIGRPAEQIVGRALREFVGANTLEECQPYIARAFAGETVSFERRDRIGAAGNYGLLG